MAHVMM
jgi:Ca2+-binding EF-hand superfamily protein